MRSRRGALLGCALAVAALSPLASATQPVVRPQPPPGVEALVPCTRDDGATTHYVQRLLRVTVNGTTFRDGFLLLQRPCGALLARAADLEQMRIRTAGLPTVEIDGEPYLNLNQYDKLRYALDIPAQALAIEGHPSIFFPTVIDFEPAPAPPPATAPGAFLNYGAFLSAPLESGDQTLNANAGLGVFGSQGVLTSDWLASRQGERQSVLRLGTTYTRDDVARIRTLRAGDVTARAGAFGSGAAIGGVQYATNFGTRPRLQTAPVNIMDAATARSAGVNLYNNDPWDTDRGPRAAFMNNLATVPYGPVQLVNMPTYNNGEYELILRDTLGGETVVRQAYFFNQGLLRPGLEDFSVEAGLLRQDLSGNDYDGAFGAATWRRGLSNTFTVEAHGEASDLGEALGGSVSWVLPWVGVLSGTAAAARHDLAPAGSAGGTGAYGALSLENRYRRLAYALREDCQSPEYLLPNVRALPTVTNACRGLLSVTGTLPNHDTLGLTASASTFRGLESIRQAQLQYGTRAWPGAQLQVYAGWSSLQQGDYTAGLSLVYSFAAQARGRARPDSLLDARRATASLTASTVDGGDASAYAQLANHAQWGDGNASARVGASLAGVERQSLALGWAGSRLQANAGVRNEAELKSYSVGASSALVWLDDSLFTSRPLFGSFAVVRLGADHGNVRVNSLRTDGDGDVVVSPMVAYYPNPVYVNPADLPLDARLDRSHFEAVPRFRSGLLLRPAVARVRGAIVSVQVVDEDGARVPLPIGAWATVAGQPEPFPVGEGGEVYVEGLDRAARLTVHYRLQQCELDLPAVSAARGGIPELGPFVCESIRP